MLLLSLFKTPDHKYRSVSENCNNTEDHILVHLKQTNEMNAMKYSLFHLADFSAGKLNLIM